LKVYPTAILEKPPSGGFFMTGINDKKLCWFYQKTKLVIERIGERISLNL
jgi:hypothetical protein